MVTSKRGSGALRRPGFASAPWPGRLRWSAAHRRRSSRMWRIKPASAAGHHQIHPVQRVGGAKRDRISPIAKDCPMSRRSGNEGQISTCECPTTASLAPVEQFVSPAAGVVPDTVTSHGVAHHPQAQEGDFAGRGGVVVVGIALGMAIKEDGSKRKPALGAHLPVPVERSSPDTGGALGGMRRRRPQGFSTMAKCWCPRPSRVTWRVGC